MAVEYADGKNQHELHNLQCLDKKKNNVQILRKMLYYGQLRSGLKGQPI